MGEEKLMKLDFQISLNAIKHFGKNLYTTNPPAIAELVANAWDAYAKECRVLFAGDSLLVIDNGIGMTDKEFQERYAISGYDKNYDVRVPNSMTIRPYMGKKGIGKFSAFSLADEYELYTKSEFDEKWKKICLNSNELNSVQSCVSVPVEYKDNIDELKEKFLFDFNFDTGTIIYLPNLKRKLTVKTTESLKQLLPRRFSSNLLDYDKDFKLYINDEALDLEKHFFYDNIENIYTISMKQEETLSKFPHLEQKNIILGDAELNINGWLATVNLPKKLKAADDTKLMGVSVYINGKIADENILKNVQDARIPNSYFIGEINADYLQNNNVDPVLSSREGLNYELEEVIKLQEYIIKKRNEIFENWNTMRASRDDDKQDYIQRAISNPKYREYYNKLDDKAKSKLKKYTQKLFDVPTDDDKKNDAIIDRMFTPLIQIVNNESIEDLVNDEGEFDILEYFEKLFKITEINHAIRLQESVKSNLLVIDELEKFVDSGEVEKVFERHLAKNPWLIEPTWIARTRSVHTQNYYELLGIDNTKPEKLYTDLVVEVSDEEYPIIVEIKREKATNYSVPDVYEVIRQLGKYKSAIAKNISQERGITIYAQDIKSYFICGDVCYKKMDKDSRDSLESNKILIRSYDQLLRTSKRIYEVNFGEDIYKDMFS